MFKQSGWEQGSCEASRLDSCVVEQHSSRCAERTRLQRKRRFSRSLGRTKSKSMPAQLLATTFFWWLAHHACTRPPPATIPRSCPTVPTTFLAMTPADVASHATMLCPRQAESSRVTKIAVLSTSISPLPPCPFARLCEVDLSVLHTSLYVNYSRAHRESADYSSPSARADWPQHPQKSISRNDPLRR